MAKGGSLWRGLRLLFVLSALLAGAAAFFLYDRYTGFADAPLSGIEAGQSYELKVTKDGYLPGYVRIAAEEWRQGGDPRLPLSAAPKRERLERTVELTPAPKKPR